MDVPSHFLWPVALGKIIILKSKLKFSPWWAGFWGAFPDIFAFTILTGWSVFTLGELHPANHALADATAQTYSLFYLTDLLYNISHSFVTLALVILILWLFKKKVYWALGGWFLHVFVDIFTHTKLEYATPFLWPISSYAVNGIAWWDNDWLLIVSYTLLGILFIYLYKEKIKKRLHFRET